MKISVAALTFFFFYACVAEISAQPTGDKDGGTIQSSGDTDCGAAEAQKTTEQLYVILRAVEAKLSDTQTEIEVLKSQVQVNKVAFGASISAGENSENIGPFNTHTTVIYKKVYFNTGSFNRGTGIFTAPVKGAYYFSFSGHNLSSKAMGLQLMKNGQQMVTVVNHVAGNRHETATNGMTLQLEVGDQVYMRLYENTWIFDNSNDHSTFIGYLLFPL
ncbi:complement C1q-like protein 4 isoform X1 [Xiphophorus couchianus]|uniref:complement C1q-like protein 4 isoform X1 n=1 Tax=Xiphophorus couchianus TaxID=32473 RepID=UPI00101623CF|nr:complement C1q-like protein 4 isoform X1 [Xiphophorus couchianus]